MRVEEKWYGETRLELNKQEQRLLQRAADLLSRMCEAVDPQQWLDYGAAADVSETASTIASAAAFVGEVAQWASFPVATTRPLGADGNGNLVEYDRSREATGRALNR